MKVIYLYLISILLLFGGCKQRFSPKPKGYLRIDLELKKDSLFQPKSCPFFFNSANYFQISVKKNCWIDIEYPKHNATIHLTYKNIDKNIIELLEESRNIAYKHTIKADAINEKSYFNNMHKTYGTLYDIKGPVASYIQFHLTDSIQHFLRGALYFNTKPNPDSLQPVIDYVKRDIIRLMETLQWREIASS